MMNWSIRYSKILTEHPELFDPENMVVEVGCGPIGIAQFLRRPVIGVEPDGMQSHCEFLSIEHGSVLQLPFRDNEVDFVVCIDVMEHIPRELRSRAIAELTRVCRNLVIISCPCHHWAVKAEYTLQAFFLRFHIGEPQWLSEHLALGVPTIDELIQPIIRSRGQS